MRKNVKIGTFFTLMVLLLGFSACTSAGGPQANQVAEPTVATMSTLDLTPDLESQGYDYWDSKHLFVYRWATSNELDELPCYSTWCNMIHVVASPECKSVAFEYDELNASGQLIGHRSDGTDTFENPDSEFAPGWGFILSDLQATDSFQLTSMVCSAEPYDWSLKDSGTSDSDFQQGTQQNPTTQDPGVPVGHYETVCQRVWVASHDPNQNGTTSIGTWENQCQEVWVNY